MRNDVITLVTKYKEGKDKKENTVEIFATQKSLSRSEFYASYGVGLKPQYIYDILPDEYEMAAVVVEGKKYTPTHVKVGEVEYTIIRTYKKNNTHMEMTVG